MTKTSLGVYTPIALLHRLVPRIIGEDCVKQAAVPVTAYSMAGRLFASRSGWLLLSVPNNLVRGVYSALSEPGLELPPAHGKQLLEAHVSVMRPDEIEQIGGIDKITERGQTFRYTLGGLKEVVPDGWDAIGKVWLVEVKSPELEKLRRSYGLSSLPKNNRHKFHVTVAVRRKRVLQNSDVRKTS